MAGIAGKEGLKLINKFVKGTPKGKSPNYGKLKAELIKKRREKHASDAEKEALSILKKNDETATMQQKARQSASSRKKPVSLAGPKEFGGKGKAYGGKVTKKAKGGSVPKGVGCATRGYGKAMK
jgi:hypothetical protein